ncbi:MAG TPA: NAD(P)-binding protein [Kofleriaceae bacterium]|nr:NAD(P)-binding protein [Kofleriaceae bacterium]
MTGPSHYDVIVVGTGMTGMSFGLQVLTRHPGKRVLLLDKHHLAGGYATSFTRGECNYDCSLHKLAGIKRGNTRRILESLNVYNDLNIKHHETYFSIRHKDLLFDLPEDADGFCAALKDRFPEDAAGIDRFHEDIVVHGKDGYNQFRMMSGDYVPNLKTLRYAHKHYKHLTVLDALNQRFKNPLVREICGAPCIYAGGLSEDLSYLYYLHILYASMVCGTGYVQGGAQYLSDTFVKHIQQRGGEVVLRVNVQEVLLDDAGTAYGIRTSDGTYFAKDVVLNCSPHYAFSSLIAEHHRPEKVLSSLEQLRPSWSTTTLYLELLDSPSALGLPHGETMLISDDTEAGLQHRRRLASAEDYELGFWEHSPMMITNYHDLDPGGGNVVCLNVLDSFDHWPKRKTPDYRPWKTKCAEVILNRFRRAFPEAAARVKRTNLATPHTYERYTNNFKGAGYGAMVGTDISGHSFHYNMPLKRLHFMSSWVAGPSYEAAMGYAEMRCKYFFVQNDEPAKTAPAAVAAPAVLSAPAAVAAPAEYTAHITPAVHIAPIAPITPAEPILLPHRSADRAPDKLSANQWPDVQAAS